MTSRRSTLIALGSGLGLAALARAGRAARALDLDCEPSESSETSTTHAAAGRRAEETADMKLHYLEIVTPEVETTCGVFAALHGVSFSEPAPELGNARTAQVAGGALLGVRAPMHEGEEPVTRPYFLVGDIGAAVEKAAAAGAEIALPPMEIRGRGSCAIYFLGGVQHALWQD